MILLGVRIQYRLNLVLISLSDLPAMKRDTRAEYLKQHIPGAVFFDIDEISDKSTPLPHMLPPKELFESSVSGMGISNGGSDYESTEIDILF